MWIVIAQQCFFNQLSELGLTERPARARRSSVPGWGCTTHRSAKLVLLVEDHENNQRVALARVTALGATAAHVAENGLEAVNAVRQLTQSLCRNLKPFGNAAMDGIELSATFDS